MKNTKKNHQGNEIEQSSRNVFRILPIVAAMARAASSSQLLRSITPGLAAREIGD